ncbi:hedgehog protein A [Seminavis robusta]|uniref:Hedgehog protein A n=1 Tax=Seminavis robusta TaxID=568900 RepID=A0A9N8DKQ6_9STRA|nr:hedgehog protein A [Seminavis robusta]|eukprot:Sro212_g088170.1 hedgehog protein A (475) ;mRNA; r:42008-43902
MLEANPPFPFLNGVLVAMKLSLAALALFPAVVAAQDTRILDCNFIKYFGSGHDLSADGVVDFNVAAGAEVTCWVDCFSGGVPQTDVAYNFGAKPTGTDDSATDFFTECKDIKTTFTAETDQTQLGWSIRAPLNYDKIIMACYCTDDGTDFTINNIEATVDNIKESIQNYISNVQDNVESYEGQGCFSESAVVQVLDQGEVAMRDLKLGDKVLTEKNTYQPVYSFGHRKPDTQMEYLQIYAEGMPAPLEMTGNHMIMVKDGKHTQAIRADRLQVGDRLVQVEAQNEVAVTEIKTAKKQGLYMPLTPNGKIVVNNVLASNYISISDEAPAVVEHTNWFFTFLSMPEQKLSHWWMAPHRMLCMGVSSSFCSDGDDKRTASQMDEKDQGILPWLLTGRKLADVAELQPRIVQMTLFGLPAFIIFGLLNLVETVLLGPSYAPFLFLVTVALIMKNWVTGSNQDKDEEESEGLQGKLLSV